VRKRDGAAADIAKRSLVVVRKFFLNFAAAPSQMTRAHVLVRSSKTVPFAGSLPSPLLSAGILSDDGVKTGGSRPQWNDLAAIRAARGMRSDTDA